MTQTNEISLKLRVVKPWWLTPASKAAIFAMSIKAAITNREPSDQECEAFGDWYARHLKIIAG